MRKPKKLPRKFLIEVRIRQLRKNMATMREQFDDRMQNSEFQIAKLEEYFKVKP